GLWNNAAVTAEACQSAASIAMNQCGPGTPATIFCNEGITLTGAVVGMAGAPGLVALMPVKILDNTGSCTTAQEVSGINYAVSHGARILNLSLGGPTDPTEESAIESAISSGCIVVAAAGNEADLYGDFGAPVTVNLDYPAGYPGVLAVGATDATTQVADYSNGGTGTGGQLLSLVAPGGGNVCGNINVSGQNAGYDPVNDFFGALLCPQANADFDTSVNASGVCDPNYGTVSGTSFSSALVSGAAALVWALYPAISNTQVAQQLMDNTDPLTVGGAPQTGWNTLSGYGLLDLDKALVNTPPPTPTFTPTSTVTPTNTITLTPTVTATLAITPTPGPSFSAYAKPNITDGQGPIQFVVSLPSALKVNLSVYNVAGEMVYAGYFPKPEGTSTILWALQNQSGSNLASGLYLYYIQAKSDSQVFQKMGKIALIR
ncbi:MAG TPA: S8 family serine peptidase, partial [bacterium]